MKFATDKGRKSDLVSVPNYHKTFFFFPENLLMVKKGQIFLNKSVHLGLSILVTSKIVMYKFWFDYVKPKHEVKAKLCYMDTDVVFQVKTQTDHYVEKTFKE